MKKIFQEYRILIAIMLGGAVLRCWSIQWGLPELYEEATPMMAAFKFWQGAGFTFNPHFFNYPALTFYIHFIAQLIHYGIGHLFGIYPNLDAFGKDLPALVVTARIVTALFDLGTVAALYILARRTINETTAIIAAGLLAINPLHIKESHLIQVDTPLTFFCVVAMIFLYHCYRDREAKWYYLTGLTIGLAAASKYTGAFFIIALVAVHMMKSSSLRKAFLSLRDRKLYFSIAIAAVVFLILDPYVLLSFQEFHDGFAFEQQHIATGHLGVNSSQSTLFYYLLDVFPSVFGWGLFIVIIGTIMYCFVHKRKNELIILLFPIIYLIIISTWEMRADRYALPAVPGLILIGAFGLTLLWKEAKKFLEKESKEPAANGKLLQQIVMVCLILLVAIEPGMATYRYLRPLGLPDTRAIAKNWILKNIPRGSVIATGPYGLDFPESQYFTLQIPFLGFESERVAPFYDTRWYQDVDLLIASDYDYARYASEPQRYSDFLPYYDTLRSKWTNLLSLEPSDDKTGPALWFYRCPDSLKSNFIDPSVFSRLEASPESTRISMFLKDLNTVCVQKGKPDKSEQILKEILSVEVENYPLRNMLAQVEINLGKYEPALTQLQHSLQTSPNQQQLFALAGHALLMLHHDREAAPTLLKALSVNTKSQPVYEDLITLYTEEHDKPALLAILKQYERILPPNSPRAKEIQLQMSNLQKK